MSDAAMDRYLAMFAPPPLTYAECIDKLFELWVANDDGQTFDEFIERSSQEPSHD